MEPFIVLDRFIIHAERSNTDPEYQFSWHGTATEIHKYSDGSWEYRSDWSSDSVEKREGARVWFEWSFCWRGVWEGRIYFKDDEYWSEDMDTMPLLWAEIQALVKSQIKNDNPDYECFDE